MLDLAAHFSQLMGATPAAIHAHAPAPQERFMAGLEGWQARLATAGSVTDRRGDRLRFGFGLYHRAADANALVERMPSL